MRVMILIAMNGGGVSVWMKQTPITREQPSLIL